MSNLETLSGIAESSSKLPPLPSTSPVTNSSSNHHNNIKTNNISEMSSEQSLPSLPTTTKPGRSKTKTSAKEGKSVKSMKPTSRKELSSSSFPSTNSSPSSSKPTKKPRVCVAKACDRCKRRKTKCDGKPACVACVNAQIVCTYSNTSVPKPVPSSLSSDSSRLSSSSPHASASHHSLPSSLNSTYSSSPTSINIFQNGLYERVSKERSTITGRQSETNQSQLDQSHPPQHSSSSSYRCILSPINNNNNNTSNTSDNNKNNNITNDSTPTGQKHAYSGLPAIPGLNSAATTAPSSLNSVMSSLNAATIQGMHLGRLSHPSIQQNPLTNFSNANPINANTNSINSHSNNINNINNSHSDTSDDSYIDTVTLIPDQVPQKPTELSISHNPISNTLSDDIPDNLSSNLSRISSELAKVTNSLETISKTFSLQAQINQANQNNYPNSNPNHCNNYKNNDSGYLNRMGHGNGNEVQESDDYAIEEAHTQLSNFLSHHSDSDRNLYILGNSNNHLSAGQNNHPSTHFKNRNENNSGNGGISGSVHEAAHPQLPQHQLCKNFKLRYTRRYINYLPRRLGLSLLESLHENENESMDINNKTKAKDIRNKNTKKRKGRTKSIPKSKKRKSGHKDDVVVEEKEIEDEIDSEEDSGSESGGEENDTVLALPKFTIPRTQAYGWNMSGGHYLPPRTIPSFTNLNPNSNTHTNDSPLLPLIDSGLCDRLLHYYFANINPIYSILHESMFLQQFQTFKATADKRGCCLYMALLSVCCAISIRFAEVSGNGGSNKKNGSKTKTKTKTKRNRNKDSDKESDSEGDDEEEEFEFPQFEPGLEEKLFEQGYTVIQSFSFEWESTEILQGWLLISFYLRACHRQSSAWMALGQAIRLASGIDLSCTAIFDQYIADYEKIKRKNVFWAVFVMDRLLCVDTGRIFSFFGDQIKIQKPSPPSSKPLSFFSSSSNSCLSSSSPSAQARKREKELEDLKEQQEKEKFLEDGWQSILTFGLVKLCLALNELERDPELMLPDDKLQKLTNSLLNWNESMKKYGLGEEDGEIYEKSYGNNRKGKSNGKKRNGNDNNNNNTQNSHRKNKYSFGLVSHFRLIYYNILCHIHTRCVFKLINPNLSISHPNLSLLSDVVVNVNELTDKMVSERCLLTPWWLTLSSIFHVGCLSLLFISNGTGSSSNHIGGDNKSKNQYIQMSTELQKVINKITLIANDGRFTMAKECLWSLKTLNHLLFLRISKVRKDLKSIGINQGESDVNRSKFLSMGYLGNDGEFKSPIVVEGEKGKDKSESQTNVREDKNENLLKDLNGLERLESQDFSLGNIHNLEPGSFVDNPCIPTFTPTCSSSVGDPIMSSSASSSTVPVPAPAVNIQDSNMMIDPAVNLDWFSNWTWEFESSLASYFTNSMNVMNEDSL